MFLHDEVMEPRLGLTGLDADLSPEEEAIRNTAHRFASEVMRPLGRKLDLLPASAVTASDSPIWDYLAAFRDSGLMNFELFAALDDQQKARILPMIFEELGWGDSGLALLGLVSSMPGLMAQALGNEELIERFVGIPGCWLGTQPDRGSDGVDGEARILFPNSRQSKGNLAAKLVGDEYIINGQSAAWVSGAPLAQCAMATIPCDYGDGLFTAKGGVNCVALFIPFDLPGITKGKPLEKIGQRPLPQGEVFFSDVRVPVRYTIAKHDKAVAHGIFAMTFANMEMATTFTGVGRAAFEHALTYAHERRQGGAILMEHQSVKMRIFDMWRKLEASRAIARRVFAYNYSAAGPHLMASITSKTFCTQAALDLTNEAIQIFGGNGLTREYPVEKLMRDARASLIEDGENNVLSLLGADWLSRWYRQQNTFVS
jgi:alkylation response protein AidB-like acyl-CoA dehydrogenase